MKHDMEKIDRIWGEAIDYMTREGFATHDVDSAIADRLYSQSLRDTDEVWKSSGHRDRDPLHTALEETFTLHYGEQGGLIRLAVYGLLLECRARREGRTHATPEA
jgi:hypothetical protein